MKILNYIFLFIIFSLFINSSISSTTPNTVDGSDSALVCDACDFVLTFAEKYLADNKTEDEILVDLHKVCNVLPNNVTCDLIVNNYADLIIKFLINNEEPSKICSILELCPKSAQSNINNDIDASTMDCSICEFVAKKIDYYIGNNKTQDEIITVLTNDCNALRSQNWIDTCQNLVESYIPIIIEMVVNKESPQVICQQIKFCPSASSSSSSSQQEEEEIKELSGDECPICVYFAGYIEQFLKDNKTEEQIIDVFDKLCNLTTKYEAMCRAMAGTYLPEIIQMFENDNNSTQICQTFKFCPSSQQEEKEEEEINFPEQLNGNEIECPLCVYLAGYIEKGLALNKTEQEITTELAKACARIEKYESMCVAMIDNYVPDLIQFFENDHTPTQVCQMIKLCPTNSSNVVVEPVFESGSGFECPLCEYIVNYAQQLLASNQTEKAIINFIQEKGCSKLPSKLSPICSVLVSSYVPNIIEMFENNFSSAQICQKFKLCVAPTTQPSIFNVQDSQTNCRVCQVLGNYANQMISNYNATNEEVYKNLCQMCKGIQSPDWRESCEEIMGENGHQLVNDIMKGVSTQDTCQDIGYCQDSSSGSSSGSTSGGGYPSSGSGNSGFSGSSGLMSMKLN